MKISTFAVLALNEPEEAKRLLRCVGEKLMCINTELFEQIIGSVETKPWVIQAKIFARENRKISMIKILRENIHTGGTGNTFMAAKYVADMVMEGSSSIDAENVLPEYIVAYNKYFA